MEDTYKVSALGLAPGYPEQTVRAGLASLLKGDPAAFEPKFQRILVNQTVILAKNIPDAAARKMHERLTAIGLLCRIDPMSLALEAKSYRCPACGHEQLHTTDGTPDICERCQIVVDQYKGKQSNRQAFDLQQAIELERRTLATQTAVVNEQQSRDAERKQAEKLRKIARRRVEKELGITFYSKLKPFLAPSISLPILAVLILAGGGVGFFVWDQHRNETGLDEAGAPTGQPGGMQIVITPPPGLSVTVGADPGVDPELAASGQGVSAEMAGAGATSSTTTPDGLAAAGMSGAESNGGAPRVDIPDALIPAPASSLNDQTTNTVASDPRILADLAFYRLDAGDLGLAANLLDRALARFNENPNAASRIPMDALLRDAVALRAGLAARHAQRLEADSAQSQWRRANLLADSIITPSFRAMAYGRLALAAHEDATLPAKKDYLSLAAATAAQSAGNPVERIDLLSTLARDMALAGQREQSATFAEQATTALSRIQGGSSQTVARSILAQRLAEAGDTEAASTMLTSAGAPSPVSAKALAALALSRAQQGQTAQAQTDFVTAIAQANALTDPVERTDALVYLARTVLQAGDPVAAEQILDSTGVWK